MAYTETNTLELTQEELSGVFGGELTELRQQHLRAHMRLAKAMGDTMETYLEWAKTCATQEEIEFMKANWPA